MTPALAATAAAQWGVFCALQASRCGVPPEGLVAMLVTGGCRRVHPDVYVVAGSPSTPQQRLWVAFLTVGEPCAFAGTTAGWFHHLPGCDVPVRPQLVVPNPRRPRTDQADVRRIAWWDRADVAVDPTGLPVLGLRDTVLTAAPGLSRGGLLAVVQHAVFTGRLSVEETRAQLRRGLPGGVRLGAVLAKYDVGHDSAPEAEVFRILARDGVAPDHCNVSVRALDGSTVGPFDGYYECGVAYEYDGREAHDTVGATTRDAAKSTGAAAIGVRVVRLTNVDRRDPRRLLRRVRQQVFGAPHRPDLVPVHRGDRACVCGWAPGTAR
ncbi:MAG TPA: hypothetical protein VNA14_02840 [Mycobacteriales bacterium]|nr:hypothetical protein [Mycobacteriales bacterium]